MENSKDRIRPRSFFYCKNPIFVQRLTNSGTDKTNIMESKITIHTGDDFKPVIKVIEKLSDDVRDNLVTQMRHILRHTSRTFTIDFLPADDKVLAAYYIMPVPDELNYFREVIDSILKANEPALRPAYEEFINEFFKWVKDPTVSPYISTSHMSIKQRLDNMQRECGDIIWSNSPEDVKFIKDFFDVLRERTT